MPNVNDANRSAVPDSSAAQHRFWRTLTLNYEHHRLKLLDLLLDDRSARGRASSWSGGNGA